MYTKAIIVSLLVMSLSLLANAQSNWRSPMIGTANRPIVILKADDYFVPTSWQTFFDIIESNNICASIGVITGWTDDLSHPENIIKIKEKHALYYTNELDDYVNRYEFWNHGYDHNDDLFGVRTKAEQLVRLQNAQNIFTTKIGFESHAFGSPGNGINQDTRYAIDQYNNENNDQLKIWMNYITPNFSSIDLSGWSYLTPFVYGPDYSHLLYGITYADASTNYQLNSSDFITKYQNLGSLITIEIHPAGYNDGGVALQNIITFLKSKNALFATPSYLYNKANIERYCGDYYGSSNVIAKKSLSAGSSVSDNCDHTTVYNGANVGFTASKIVYLMPGFKSLNGSTFKASIATNGLPGGRVAKTDIPVKIPSSESKIMVYPNPNEGVLVIDFGDNQLTSSSIFVYNSTGQLIRNVNSSSLKETIDLSNVANGLFIVQVLSGNSLSTYKVLKK